MAVEIPNIAHEELLLLYQFIMKGISLNTSIDKVLSSVRKDSKKLT